MPRSSFGGSARSARWRTRDIAPLASFGQPLPGYVQRQNAIEGLIGEEVAAAVNGQKPIDRALADAERRVNMLLAEVE